MALMKEITCKECGETVYESVVNGVYPTTCSKCLQKAATQRKITYLKGLQALTLTKRIALIEEYIYDDKARYKESDLLK